MSQPSFPPPRSLAAVFLRHGNMTFGGGSATIATLHREIVTKRDWVTQRHAVGLIAAAAGFYTPPALCAFTLGQVGGG